MTSLAKPLKMSDTEILNWYICNHTLIGCSGYPNKIFFHVLEGEPALFDDDFRKLVCQAAAIK